MSPASHPFSFWFCFSCKKERKETLKAFKEGKKRIIYTSWIKYFPTLLTLTKYYYKYIIRILTTLMYLIIMSLVQQGKLFHCVYYAGHRYWKQNHFIIKRNQFYSFFMTLFSSLCFFTHTLNPIHAVKTLIF